MLTTVLPPIPSTQLQEPNFLGKWRQVLGRLSHVNGLLPAIAAPLHPKATYDGVVRVKLTPVTICTQRVRLETFPPRFARGIDRK